MSAMQFELFNEVGLQNSERDQTDFNELRACANNGEDCSDGKSANK